MFAHDVSNWVDHIITDAKHIITDADHTNTDAVALTPPIHITAKTTQSRNSPREVRNAIDRPGRREFSILM